MTRLAEEKSAGSMTTHGRPWLEHLRKAAMDRFSSVGYPTTQEEDWRLTNLAPVAKINFAAPTTAISEEAQKLAGEASFGREAVAELVFVNGHYAGKLSKSEKLPQGASVRSLCQASDADWRLAERHLGQLADLKSNPLAALNAASFRGGVLVHLARGAVVEGAIHLLFVSTSDGEPTASHPRVLVVAEDRSQLTLVETFVGGRDVHLTNAVTEIHAGDDLKIDYSRLQRGGSEAYSISTFAARLGRASQLISHCATLGGKLTRNDLNVRMDGEGADATINGLAILTADQHCDNHTLLDHAAAYCPSHELYKHVLNGKSSCVFRGKILVQPGAQKTDSKQTSKSLLLSDDATMNSQPALEIYADDVKCTHGSTTGPVDEDMVFYLRTRGVSLEAARHLLTYAFAADVTRRIRVEPVRRRLEDFLAAQHGLPRDLRITDLGQHDEKAR